MSFYEIATLRTDLGAAGTVAESVARWAADGGGHLLGAFATDIGPLNEILLLRRYHDLAEMFAERERTILSSDPMGCAASLVDMRFDTYRPFDFLPDVTSRTEGPIYEFRSYLAMLDGMGGTQDRWREAVPARSAYSTLAFAGWAIDGPPRVTHIWPYASHEARTAARARSVADGNWPPKGGPALLTSAMTSTIAVPLDFSEMR